MAKTPEEMCGKVITPRRVCGLTLNHNGGCEPTPPAPIAAQTEKRCECEVVLVEFCPKHGNPSQREHPTALELEEAGYNPADFAPAEQVDAARLEPAIYKLSLKGSESALAWLHKVFGVKPSNEVGDSVNIVTTYRDGVAIGACLVDREGKSWRLSEALDAYAASLKQETQPRDSFVADNLVDDDPSAPSPLETPAAVPETPDKMLKAMFEDAPKYRHNFAMGQRQRRQCGCYFDEPHMLSCSTLCLASTPAPADTGAHILHKENIAGFCALIKEKCEFYWNLDDIGNAEIHATLERIHEYVRKIESLAQKSTEMTEISCDGGALGKILASTGDTPQPQERKGAALLDWFIAGIRTYTSPDPMPFADETYELRKKIIGYIEAGQNAALGKTPDALTHAKALLKDCYLYFNARPEIDIVHATAEQLRAEIGLFLGSIPLKEKA